MDGDSITYPWGISRFPHNKLLCFLQIFLVFSIIFSFIKNEFNIIEEKQNGTPKI